MGGVVGEPPPMGGNMTLPFLFSWITSFSKIANLLSSSSDRPLPFTLKFKFGEEAEK
jgi:hypothetical protein